ncbi:MAG TPA: histidinol-phosphate transaminase, partial [Gemmatimonadaceae bacterium]|nr:histidinol-phosphate transaminase [Gemmatimonadaceae bacterium]
MSTQIVRGRRDLSGFRGYAVSPAGCRIDLSDNTNAWGMPPAAGQALAAIESTNRYPSPYSDELKEAIAGYTGAPPEMITTGCGSDDVLDSAIRVFAGPGEAVAYPVPTFPMIPLFARLNGSVPIAVPMTAGFSLDIDAMLASDARVLYVCSPNNPTGNAIAREDLESLVRRSSSEQVIIVDEAYAEFAGATAIDLATSCDRVIVTRTMSKAFGLAGLRVGYALGSPALVAGIETSRGPYKVSAMGERAAIAALTEGLDWVNEHVALAIENRRRLERALLDRGITAVRSSANFVWFRID